MLSSYSKPVYLSVGSGECKRGRQVYSRATSRLLRSPNPQITAQSCFIGFSYSFD